MKYSHTSLAAKWLALPPLLLALIVGQLPGQVSASAHTNKGVEKRAQLADESAAERAAGKVSPDLLDAVRKPSKQDRLVKVILQLNTNKSGAVIDLLLQSYGARTTRQFLKLNARAVELPARAVEALASHGELGFISPDRESVPAGHVSLTTGADAVRDMSGTKGTELDGTGIGIAVLDSGMDAGHRSFLGRSGNTPRIVASRDFTGEGRTDDLYGHGTHVAAAAAGNGQISNGAYTGIAPN
ncbi:MAG TPA: S8 family serine peptidase, partial [Pyrinomonadaceae bacterium]|nr:S8 family serine peptidase [Pyrinomonadaceae bacterium]